MRSAVVKSVPNAIICASLTIPLSNMQSPLGKEGKSKRQADGDGVDEGCELGAEETFVVEEFTIRKIAIFILISPDYVL